ncbi:MAG: hypothetical protein HKN13_09085 [Rhodothermales bacterium]|nr:hypothetical protein [Rhodothermales bacterium]
MSELSLSGDGDELPSSSEMRAAGESPVGTSDPARASADDQMDVLRRLLIAPEQEKLVDADERLRALETRKTDLTPGQLAEILPDAVVQRSATDRKLASALEPTIEETLRGSVRRNPQPLVDAIFPVIGPAIRRAIAEALSSTLESVNRTVEHQFSVQGLRWRWEAIRTGRDFSEVVLRNTLLYATEQLFVIDNDTGLPLVHAARPNTESQDGSLVTSMLSVIQDFVRDSLGGDQSDSLESIEYGDLTILFEPGPTATLAAVLRGTPPRGVREDMQEIIEDFHLRYRSELESYNGDASLFDKAKPLLYSNLKVQMHESSGTSWQTWLIIGLIILGLVLAGWYFFRARANWNEFVTTVDNVPGIVVTEVSRDAGARIVHGLRDPLSDDPVALLGGFGYDSDDVRFRFEPYRALSSDIIARRAGQFLDAPETTRFTYSDQTLYASGVAGHRWIEAARVRAAQLEDVQNYDDAALVDSDFARLLDLSDEMVRLPVRFAVGGLSPTSLGGFDGVVDRVNEGLEIGREAGIEVSVVVRGFSSVDGSPVANELLEMGRARSIRAQLIARGVAADRILIDRGGVATPEARVILRIEE